MTNIYELFNVNADAAENGVWANFGPIGFKVRRFKSKKSRDVRRALEAPYRVLHKTGDLPEDVSTEISIAHIAEGIIADWRGITDSKGEPVAYSKAAAIKLLNDLPELRDTIAEFALSVEHYRNKVEEDTAGN